MANASSSNPMDARMILITSSVATSIIGVIFGMFGCDMIIPPFILTCFSIFACPTYETAIVTVQKYKLDKFF
jgi:hypothetical protein